MPVFDAEYVAHL